MAEAHEPGPPFDRIAGVYRPLEYLSFGHALERTRECYLPALGSARHALVLGDGDGRFLAKLLLRNRELRALSIDSSERMLALQAARCSYARERLVIWRGDLRIVAPPAPASTGQEDSFDLVVTHFVLDCLSEAEVETLVRSVCPHLSRPAWWVVSEFRVPDRGMLRILGRVLIRSLYCAFRLLTGLRVRRMPDYAAALRRAGFYLEAQQLQLRGLLAGELWRID